MPESRRIEDRRQARRQPLQSAAYGENEGRRGADHDVDDAQARSGDAVIGSRLVRCKWNGIGEFPGDGIPVVAHMPDLPQGEPDPRRGCERNGDNETPGQHALHGMREYRGRLNG